MWFTARGDRVWALCWSDPDRPEAVTLPMQATPKTSATTLNGTTLATAPTPSGLRVEFPASDAPIVAIAVDGVTAAP